MSATTTFPATAGDTAAGPDPGQPGMTDAPPDGIRIARGILVGGALSCGIWAGIAAAVMAAV